MSKTIINSHSKIYLLVIIILAIKLILLPYSQTESADAVSRIFESINWMKNPIWIKKSVWAPFHFYINGVALFVWDNRVITPKIVNILFSSFTLIPFYFLTKREFNKNGAIIAAIFLAVSPILFRNSFLALSETPYLFFLTLTINLLSKAIRENSFIYIFLSGISITIAAGIRYEAWIIIGVLSLIIILIRRWKMFLLFNLAALLFPLYWLLSNFIETGNPLYSIQGTYNYALDVMDGNANMDLESYLRRIWYFPFSWIIAIGIPSGFIILKIFFKSYSKKYFNKSYFLYSIPFWIMFTFFQYNTFNGVLLTQHRYTGTLVILSLPFIALYFNNLTSKKLKLAVVYGLLTISLSFVYNSNGIIPLPRLEDQSNVRISEIINKNILPTSCLIIDFIGWDNTYYLALRTNLPNEQIVITEGAKHSKIPLEIIRKKFIKHNEGIILLNKNSKLFKELSPNNFNIENHQINFSKLYQKGDVILFSWSKDILPN